MDEQPDENFKQNVLIRNYVAELAVLEDRADYDPQVKCLLPCLQTYKHAVCENKCS